MKACKILKDFPLNIEAGELFTLNDSGRLYRERVGYSLSDVAENFFLHTIETDVDGEWFEEVKDETIKKLDGDWNSEYIAVRDLLTKMNEIIDYINNKEFN